MKETNLAYFFLAVLLLQAKEQYEATERNVFLSSPQTDMTLHAHTE